MSETKFTPGPWGWWSDNHLEGADKCEILAAADDGKEWGMQSGIIEHHFDDEIKEANKALIAAAPDLYRALEAFANNSSVQANNPHECEIAEAVLAKARGEQ